MWARTEDRGPFVRSLGATPISGKNALGMKSWEFAKGGAKRIVRFCGGKTYHKAPPPKPVL